MSIMGRVAVVAGVCTLSFVVGCGGEAKGNAPGGEGGASVAEGGASTAAGGDSTGSGGRDAAQSEAEELCGIKADARMSCHDDYDGYDSRAEYVTACVEEESTFSCGFYDLDSMRPLIACQASCDDSITCVSDTYTTIADVHPDRATALRACGELIDECFSETDLEGRDESLQDCLGYLFANEDGAKRLDACVSAGCDGLYNCLDAALDCE